MSAQLFNEIAQAKQAIAELNGLVQTLKGQLEHASGRIAALEAERREQNKSLQTIKDQVASLHAMKAGIEEDAKRIGIATRDRIDPTTAKMPQVLKSMGYGAKR